jgi:transposase-like protein
VAFGPILKEFFEEALESEMEGHLADEEKGSPSGNKRNGKGQKTVKSSHGEVTISTPQDRNSSFEPKIIEKRQRILADNLEQQIMAMYGMINSLRDISGHIREMSDTDISTQVISGITDRMVPRIREWQERPPEPVYCIVWQDAMDY